VPDTNTIWTFREALTRARIAGKSALEVLVERFDAALSAAGLLAMSGQISDAAIVAAPKQRNTGGEKRDLEEGRIPPEWAKKTERCVRLDGQHDRCRAGRFWPQPRQSRRGRDRGDRQRDGGGPCPLPHVARLIVANPLQVKAIAHAHVKTDKIDAGVLAPCILDPGSLPRGHPRRPRIG
jgi:hypothetical protein